MCMTTLPTLEQFLQNPFSIKKIKEFESHDLKHTIDIAGSAITVESVKLEPLECVVHAAIDSPVADINKLIDNIKESGATGFLLRQEGAHLYVMLQIPSVRIETEKETTARALNEIFKAKREISKAVTEEDFELYLKLHEKYGHITS